MSSVEANKVLDTVHDWLAYLASSAEVDAALAAFKRKVEAGELPVHDQSSASLALSSYFSQSLPAQAAVQHDLGRGIRADVLLRFAERLVVIEVKFLRRGSTRERIDDGLRQLEFLMEKANADRGALVVFSGVEPEPGHMALVSLSRGKVSVVTVRIPSSDA